MARKATQIPRTVSSHRHWCARLGAAAACLAIVRSVLTFTPHVTGPQHPAAHPRSLLPTHRTARLAKAIYETVNNPIKTVSETIADFYKGYPQPPVLPMYRSFLIDLLTQTHLAVVDSRFTYDAIFALGLTKYYQGLFGTYDKLLGGPQSEKIWQAFAKSVGLDPDKVKADADAVSSYGKSTSPAQILKDMEGSVEASDKAVASAFKHIGSSLYTSSFSIGLFTIMEMAGVEVSKDNVEEWAKALKITPSKVTSDLSTYKLNKQKLQQAEEMIREVEIREKKKLAERLEEKAKKLAAKAADRKAALA